MYKESDYNKLNSVAKDRLDKVLETMKKKNIRFPQAEINRKMKTDKGVISAYLNAKKPISENFYTSFIQHFGEKAGGPQGVNMTNESDHPNLKTEKPEITMNELVESNKILAESH